MDVNQLNQTFGRPGLLSFAAGLGNLICCNLTTPACTGTVYLHGGHVTQWTPAGYKPVLFLSRETWTEPAKPMRGGVPVCWPWFGDHATDSNMPAHGFARLLPWDVESVQADDPGNVELVLRLTSGPESRRYVPWDFTLRHRIRFGKRLTMTLETTNPGPQDIKIEEALHTYFAVGDVRSCQVMGLNTTEFLDKMDNMRRKRQDGAITFSRATDRVYLDAPGATRIIDTSWGRTITIEKTSSQNTVVWNPWVDKAHRMPDFADDEWPQMLCVETANVGAAAVEIPPGQTHMMEASIGVT
jgi:glucose-6-phosphate 1-epimerase